MPFSQFYATTADAGAKRKRGAYEALFTIYTLFQFKYDSVKL